MGELYSSISSLWRNRLARSAVNRKVGGSSPPRDESLIFALYNYVSSPNRHNCFCCFFIFLPFFQIITCIIVNQKNSRWIVLGLSVGLPRHAVQAPFCHLLKHLRILYRNNSISSLYLVRRRRRRNHRCGPRQRTRWGYRRWTGPRSRRTWAWRHRPTAQRPGGSHPGSATGSGRGCSCRSSKSDGSCSTSILLGEKSESDVVYFMFPNPFIL